VRVVGLIYVFGRCTDHICGCLVVMWLIGNKIMKGHIFMETK